MAARFVVIFRAQLADVDADYSAMAERLRCLALSEFGCLAFTSCTEADEEIALSYWSSRSHIDAWRKHPEHRLAQKLGKSKWYRRYQVEIAELS